MPLIMRPEVTGVFGLANNEGRMFLAKGCHGHRPCVTMDPHEFEELVEMRCVQRGTDVLSEGDGDTRRSGVGAGSAASGLL